jgi:hypothetical protein
VDRNWFLFYYLLATKGHYRTPVYTSLGNHDWRINPYPPKAPGTPAPEEMIHNSADFTPEEHGSVLKRVIEIAHGPGHGKKFAYADLAGSTISVLQTAWTAAKAIPSFLFGTPANLDRAKLPTHTTVESIAWYLLVINPFLDYQFSLHTGHQFLMLDFAEQEELNNAVENHKQGPRALTCLTTLQQWHIERLVGSTGRAKTIGMHVPPIGPRPDWSEHDLLKGVKTHAYPRNPMYKNRYSGWKPRTLRDRPLPLLAVAPEGFSPWLAAVYGSFVNRNSREWMIRKLLGSSVRLVLSGHIHRQDLLTVNPDRLPLAPPGPREPVTMLPVLAVKGTTAQQVKGAVYPAATTGQRPLLGPVYVNTTSGGPKGNRYFGSKYQSVPPGYSRIQLSSDGTIGTIENFMRPRATAAPRAVAR